MPMLMGLILQFCDHGDVCAERSRDHACSFSADRRVNEFGLGDSGKLGDDVQIHLRDRPTNRQLLQSQRRGGYYLTLREANRPEFVGKGQRKAACVRGSYQFGGVRLSIAFEWNARRDTSLL